MRSHGPHGPHQPLEPRALVKRIAGTLDVRSTGLVFALTAMLICIVAFGLAPTALALGLLALLVVD